MLQLATIPLRLAPFLTIVVLSSVLAFAWHAGPAGWPLLLMLSGWFFRYSFEFLDSMIGGAREAPVLAVEMLIKSIGEWRTLLPLTLVVVLFLTSGAIYFWLGALLTGLVLLAAVVSFPAVLAIQGWTGKIGQALGPAHCVRMAHILGDDYSRMVVITALIASLCAAVIYVPAPTVLRIAVFCYAWLALIAMTGGTVYLRRGEIEDATEFLDKRQIVESPEEIAQRRENVIDSIYAAWRNGAQENAWQTLRGHVAASQEPLSELRILYRRVAAWEHPQLGRRVAEELVGQLLAQDREGEALALARERVALDADFRPRSEEELKRLVEIARANTDRPTAEALQRNLTRVS